ncbi:MAG TPA: amino acid racemase [Terriglobales bacterium]|nr:amino acid racemase [Terriglobales bacterium]
MAQHIGIVACTAEGASLCYRTICHESAIRMGKDNHPEVSMHTIALAEYLKCVNDNNWVGVAELMLNSAEKLARAGADFLICPDNTIHQPFDLIEHRSPRPWLHIAQEVANEAVRKGYKRLGITGTRYLMESQVYPEKLKPKGLEFRIPAQKEREQINQIIFEELVNGKFLPRSLAYFTEIIRTFKDEGCDAVVLGCTEIPLLVMPESSPLPTLDSTRLLARAALNKGIDT